VSAKATRYGCKDPECGYTTLPSTMGTPYARCPLCGGEWTADPPARVPPQMTVQEYDPATGRDVGKPRPVPPHLASLYAAKCAASPPRRPG
jgi:hypothetical protein